MSEMMQQTERIPDVQYLGMLTKHSLTCAICGADLPEDMDFQARHFETAHRLEC